MGTHDARGCATQLENTSESAIYSPQFSLGDNLFHFTKLSFSGSEKILTMNRQQTLFLIISEKYFEKHRETGKTEALVLTLVRI